MHLARAVVAVVVIAASPVVLSAPCAGFNDVSDADPFCVYVDWIKNRGITLGTTATTYSPDLPVTRMQMAAFMYRLGFQNAFLFGGNAFGTTAVLGTTDNHALDLTTGSQRAMRYEPNPISPNLIGGSPANLVAAGLRGATIAGGGLPSGDTDPQYDVEAPNVVLANYGVIGGGYGNVAGGGFPDPFAPSIATVAGGMNNVASATLSTIGGGQFNTASGARSTISGGWEHVAGGQESSIAGGRLNVANGAFSTVAGGLLNVASGDYSLAAGWQATTASPQGEIHRGAFVWSDAFGQRFHSSAANEFAARATGGVRFVTSADGAGNPTRTLRINPNGELEFGFQTRQMLNLWGAEYGIGVQGGTTYLRSGAHYAWFAGGAHSDASFDPGGGALLMSLSPNPTILTLPVGTARAQTFVSVSDRSIKREFESVDVHETLAKVVALPIERWSYRNHPDVRHIGPVAQDFHAAFGVGGDDRTIATVDAYGVALAAIQGLNAKLAAERATTDAAIASLRAEAMVLRSEIAELRALRDELAALRHASLHAP